MTLGNKLEAHYEQKKTFLPFIIIQLIFVDQTLCADLQKKSKDLGKAVKDNCKAARKCK